MDTKTKTTSQLAKTTNQLLRELELAEQAVDVARAEIMRVIRERLGDVTPYAFARAAGINRSNFYNCLNGRKWNGQIALRALDFLSTPLRDHEVELATMRLNARDAEGNTIESDGTETHPSR